MSISFLNSLDLGRNELLNARIQSLATAPLNPVEGLFYWNSNNKHLYIYNGSDWVDLNEVIQGMQAHGNEAHTSLFATESALADGLDTKVDKIVGKGLSTEDYTTAEKTKLSGIEAGAQVNVATNIAQGTRTTTTVPITSSTGSDATLQAASPTLAGVMVAADKSKLDDATAVATASKLILRDASGRASVATPSASTDIATKGYVDGILGANDAMVYKGALNASTNPNYPAANAGDTYKVSHAGKLGGASGVNVEVGDMAICTVDSTASGTQATVGANWTIIQVNIDGAVVGPATSTGDNFAAFDGTGGKLIKDSGKKATDFATAGHTHTDLHSHANKAVLDDISNAGSGAIITTTERNKLNGIAANANNYAHPTGFSSQPASPLANANVISQVTVNTNGHVTGVASRAITPVDIGATRKVSFDVPNNASPVFEHNLASRDVAVSVRENTAPYAQVYCGVEMTTTNTITLFFATAPVANAYRVTVIG